MIRRAFQTLACLLLVTAAKPCGPFVPTFNLSVRTIADGDPKDWAAGKMGLIQPGLHTSDLVVAWRWLKGVGLDAAEQKAVLDGPYDPRPGLETWKKARQAAGAGDIKVDQGTVADDYRTTNRVGNHALLLAAETLNARVAKFGKDSVAVKQWLATQDRVFDWRNTEALPEVASDDLPLLIRQDRAYQKAAALLYREHIAEAVEGFQAVADDAANPWRGWGRFMVARYWDMGGGVGDQAALKLLEDLQRDPAFPQIHGAAGALENLIRFQNYPVDFYARLLANLGRKDRGVRLAQDIEDLRWLRVLEPWTKELKDTKPSGVHAWIDCIQKGSLDDAIKAWEAEPDTANLVAVMLKLTPDHARAGEFLKAAQAASHPGPAYAALVSHRLRVLVAQKRMKAAEALADEALAQPGAVRWPSAFNLWSSVKLACAPDVEGFAKHLGRRLASVTEDGWSSGSERLDNDEKDRRLLKALDPFGVALLNRQMPLRLWEAVLTSPHLPSEIKPELLEALWARAAVLDREDVMTRHREALAKARPLAAVELAGWAKEKDPAKKRALAYLLIWEHRFWPQLLSVRDEAFKYGTVYARWTGPVEEKAPSLPGPDPKEGVEAGLGSYSIVLSPAFLDAAARKEGSAEAARVPAPLTWFCEQALAFAEARPKDPEVPEALSKAVRSSRNANRDARSAALLVKAFRLLHKQYPNTPEAKAASVYH